jgi:hypothetical protein
LQSANILFANSLPLTGECVCLAEISAQGEITDKREFARAKVATMGRNLSVKANLVKTEYKAYKDSDIITGYKRYAVAVVDADISKFNFVVADDKVNMNRSVFDLKKNCFVLAVDNYNVSGTLRVVYTDNQKWYAGSGTKQMYGFEVVDGVLTLFTDIRQSEESFINYPGSMTITLV